jgi:hypothetical protein
LPLFCKDIPEPHSEAGQRHSGYQKDPEFPGNHEKFMIWAIEVEEVHSKEGLSRVLAAALAILEGTHRDEACWQID